MIRRRDYDLALLTSRVPGFFTRFGFVEAPAVLGYQCPATALSRLTLPPPYTLEKLDYYSHWPVMARIYQEYSACRTGMQVRDTRFWESWPRRGTFPHGFSQNLDAIGLLAMAQGRPAAYLAAQCQPDQPHMTVTDFAHLNDAPEAILPLLRAAANAYLEQGGRRVVIHTGSQAPVLQLLEAQSVPIELEVGQGLMALVTNREWLKPSGFRNDGEAIRNLFFSSAPVMWHRDGY
jgi:predicted acetyltransferase